MIKTRKSAVAGSFYPSDKKILINQIDDYLDRVQRLLIKGDLRILIMPHAGYEYSGQTAAWGFKQLSQNYQRIILLGVSHSSYFANAAVWDKGLWQTPLGELAVDEGFAKKVISQSQEIKANQLVHIQEHSLEVQLPFLQKVLKNFKIIPILLSQKDENFLENLAQILTKVLDEKTLLVISSDLSHYPAYEVANRVDKETIESVLSGSVNRFNQVTRNNLNQPGVETCACGGEVIKVAMMVAKKLKINKIKLFNYVNSGDITGDKTRVVGYAAIGFYAE